MKGPESIARPADHGAQAASRVAAQTRRPRCARRLNGAALDPACAPWVKGVWAMDVRGPPAGAPDPGVHQAVIYLDFTLLRRAQFSPVSLSASSLAVPLSVW